MKINSLHIRNFKSIRDMSIENIEDALILVGRNNTGKTTVLDVIRAVGGDYEVQPSDFGEDNANIEVQVTLNFSEEDLDLMHQKGIVSKYHRKEAWMQDFQKKFPSYQNGCMTFTFSANVDGKVRYNDGFKKDNKYIPQVFPKIYYVDTERCLEQLQKDLLLLQEDDILAKMRSGCCMFNQAKKCNHCFSCIGLIMKKQPEEMDVFETSKLLDYKLYQMNLNEFGRKVNENFRKNGGKEEIIYSMEWDMENLLNVSTEIYHPAQNLIRPIGQMGKGMRSMYLFSLLETYAEQEENLPSIIMIEDPEIFLHPRLQKNSRGDIVSSFAEKSSDLFYPFTESTA